MPRKAGQGTLHEKGLGIAQAAGPGMVQAEAEAVELGHVANPCR